jgi:tetratricopeptide (TPR) repeat protein
MRARTLKRVRERHEDPYIDADVTPEMLIKSAYNDLKTLDKENADVVARHLVMVARLLDEDPEKAHMHAISASRRGGRIGLTRETLGITAYTIGDFALALRELKTYQRITGRDDQIALMVDSERGVGRPDKALEVGRSVDRTKLDDSVQVNLAIAMSGARLDLEQTELALAELEIPQLRADKAYAYHAPLYFAYGDVLAELGREEEAAKWERRGELLDAALDKMEIDGGTDESMGIETEYETAVEEVASDEVVMEKGDGEEAEPEAPTGEASDA